MGHMDHASFGWLTPTLSYAMACVGAALGLRCTVRALATTGPSRRNWLITAASALGTGIWTMHFIAMLGFSVSGTEIRYNVPLTVLSLVVAMLVVAFKLTPSGRRTTTSVRIAVLPFENLATRPAWEVEASADDLINALATVPGSYALFSVGIAATPELVLLNRSQLDLVVNAVAPHETGHAPNFTTKPVAAERFYDPFAYRRLQSVKAAYDPTGLFLANHAIRPAR